MHVKCRQGGRGRPPTHFSKRELELHFDSSSGLVSTIPKKTIFLTFLIDFQCNFSDAIKKFLPCWQAPFSQTYPPELCRGPVGIQVFLSVFAMRKCDLHKCNLPLFSRNLLPKFVHFLCKSCHITQLRIISFFVAVALHTCGPKGAVLTTLHSRHSSRAATLGWFGPQALLPLGGRTVSCEQWNFLTRLCLMQKTCTLLPLMTFRQDPRTKFFPPFVCQK